MNPKVMPVSAKKEMKADIREFLLRLIPTPNPSKKNPK
jgi:hypothetical protein